MKKPGIIKRIVSFLLRVCVVIVLMAAIAVGSFEGVTYYLTGKFADLRKTIQQEAQAGYSEKTTSGEETPEVDNKNLENRLVFLQDETTQKEYMSLLMYNKKTDAMDILLIPADAQVTVGNSLLKEIRRTIDVTGSSLNMAEIFRSFGDEQYKMAVKIMEDISGITISGYDVINKENFLKLLNAAGKVPYHLDYTISFRNENQVLKSLEKGDVLFDGKAAYALMTYRDGSDTEESDRLERTSVYLESYLEKLFSKNKKSSIAKKYDSLVSSNKKAGMTDTKTMVKKLSPESCTVRIMQGSESGGLFTLDTQKVKLQAVTLAKQSDAYKKDKAEEESRKASSGENESGTGEEDSKHCSIEIYNAAYVSGLATKWESFMEEEGYQISLVDSYQEEGPLSRTRINVTKEGMGEDLFTYFPDAEINRVDEISTGGDIQIFIGTDSTRIPDHQTSAFSDDGDSEADEKEEEDSDSYSFDTDSE
ncbi:MAG: LCP family protein [Eubacterium sp.]|nr:LCP family protein [Eubacterium sp.]MDD7209549.1 LCP family protein [Lachnospiraceae bacterium]MDY5498433.1 LCP family protein [Anaerobutyricum sp.]